jgi:hypothetical protein
MQLVFRNADLLETTTKSKHLLQEFGYIYFDSNNLTTYLSLFPKIKLYIQKSSAGGQQSSDFNGTPSGLKHPQ